MSDNTSLYVPQKKERARERIWRVVFHKHTQLVNKKIFHIQNKPYANIKCQLQPNNTAKQSSIWTTRLWDFRESHCAHRLHAFKLTLQMSNKHVHTYALLFVRVLCFCVSHHIIVLELADYFSTIKLEMDIWLYTKFGQKEYKEFQFWGVYTTQHFYIFQ